MNAREIGWRLAELIGEDTLSPLDAHLPVEGCADEASMVLDGGDGTKFLLTIKRQDSTPTRDRIFLADADGFLCSDCFPPGLDVGSPHVQTWLEGSDGWLGPIECRSCGRPIPVEVEDPTAAWEEDELCDDCGASPDDGHELTCKRVPR